MKKKYVLLIIFLLTIGFASLSTNIFLKGTLGLTFDEDDFKIIFVDAKLDNVRKKDFISDDKETINFTNADLKNETTVLSFSLANTSRQYDAEVQVSCKSSNPDNYEFLVEPSSFLVLAGSDDDGVVNITAKQSETLDNITCSFTVEELSRTELADAYSEAFSRSGVLMTTTSTNTEKFWGYKNDITKVVFEDSIVPHETTENLIFDVSVNQDETVMSYLVPNEDDNTKYTLYIQSDTGVKANADSSELFRNFTNLLTVEGLEYFDTSDTVYFRAMFRGCTNLLEVDLSHFDTSKATRMDDFLRDCSSLKNVDFSSFDTSLVKSFDSFIRDCASLESVDVSHFNTSKVINMYSMFAGCLNLKELDLSNFDVSRVTTMESMFRNCYTLTSLDVTNFDTSKVTLMSDMFHSCFNLTSLDLSSFDTSKVTDMNEMFNNCENLEVLDISNFNTVMLLVF